MGNDVPVSHKYQLELLKKEEIQQFLSQQVKEVGYEG